MNPKKAVSIVLTSTLMLSMLLVAIPKVQAQQTTVRFYASPYEVHTLSQIFTVACVVEDVVDLSAFVLQMEWDTSLLEYQSHHNTYVATAWPAPNNPSPYAGVLTGAASELPGTGVDPVLGIQRIDVFTLPATKFTGDGTMFTMTFKALNDALYGDPATYISTALHVSTCTLVSDIAVEIPRELFDGEVRLYYREFEYPPLPMLRVNPALYEADVLGENFDINVQLLGAGSTDLSGFWDIDGIDVMMHFDPTLIQAVSMTLDPDGKWGTGVDPFYPGGIYPLIAEIDNTAGTVQVAYVGLPGPHGVHIPPYGIINMFKVTFTVIYESTTFPPPSAAITLWNPTAYTNDYVFNSIGGLINPAAPLGTDWSECFPYAEYGSGPFELTTWDDNGDGQLGAPDQVILDDGSFYFDYKVNLMTGAMDLTHLYKVGVEDYVWPVNFPNAGLDNSGLPGYIIGDPTVGYNGFGVPNWVGTFTIPGLAEVTQITVHEKPFTADETTRILLEGVDYTYNAATDEITLLNPVDVLIVDEHWTDGVDNSLNGWPFINYAASAIMEVSVDKHDGAGRVPSPNAGYENPPPGDWWYEPDYPWELEGWWALGYFPDPSNWPAGSEWWLTYYAASYLTIDYLGEPDGIPRNLAYDGSYADFLAALPAPVGTFWNEVYPVEGRVHEIVEWDDVNTNGLLDAGDTVTTEGAEGLMVFGLNSLVNDIYTSRKPWICETVPSDPFFGMAPIVYVAGFPHPEREYCPWHNADYSVPIPHIVQNGMYTAPFKPLGGFIDVYVCNYAPGFKGEGKDKPADMFWPQKEVKLCANVTYAGWPEQNKDVAFEIKFPNGTVFVVMYARTDANGHAEIPVRLPWPCDDPEAIFGKWKVWATVDVACVVVNDTMEFKYDYRIHIWDVTTNKEEYKHCEDIIVTVEYGSYLIQTALGHLIITLTVTDASGVPIGFDYVAITLGTDDMADWCRYLNGTVELSVHVVKWARPPIGTIYVGALTDFPQNGGCAETPVYITEVAILAEWA